MLLNMFRRTVKPQTPANKTTSVGCHGETSSDEESSALIADSARFTVSETYVVPDINGQFPTDLSDSDDDFFEKTCQICNEDLQGATECKKCSSSSKGKVKEPSPERKHQTGTQTRPQKPTLDNFPKLTRTLKTYTEEELEAAKRAQKNELKSQTSVISDT
ncbi:hypothetical protein ACHWQZ_G004169 [Mnemiopsis leidyi]